jgi:hypothetical protein
LSEEYRTINAVKLSFSSNIKPKVREEKSLFGKAASRTININGEKRKAVIEKPA